MIVLFCAVESARSALKKKNPNNRDVNTGGVSKKSGEQSVKDAATIAREVESSLYQLFVSPVKAESKPKVYFCL